jgi:hypothetical protein
MQMIADGERAGSEAEPHLVQMPSIVEENELITQVYY